MSGLIEALTIFSKYNNPKYPTRCERGVMVVMVDHTVVSASDIARLTQLGFNASSEYDGFRSYRLRRA